MILATTLADRWADWMLAMGWQVLLLGAVVLVLDALLRRMGFVRLRHGLWCLVAVKLLLPPTLVATTPVLASLADRLAPTLALHADAPTAAPDAAPAASAAVAASDPSPWPLALATLWLLGVALLTLRALRAHRRLRADVDARGLPAPAWVDELARAVAERLGLRRVPTITTLPHLASPAVFGPLRPRVLLPQVSARPDADATTFVEHVLLHELMHVRRRDLWAQALFGALRTLYWFHPVAHLAARRAEALREVCCDLGVAAHLGDGTGAYRDTLLRAAAARLLPGETIPVGASFLRAGSPTLARLRALDGNGWKHARTKRACAFATAFLLGALLLPMACAPAPDAETDAEHAARVRNAEALLDRTLTERGTYGCYHRRFAFQQLLALEESR